jgi:hypothetical protein
MAILTYEMKLYALLLVLCTILIPHTSIGQRNCIHLKDGNYEFKFANADDSIDFRLAINGDKFIRTAHDGQQIIGNIKWLHDCLFVLDHMIPKTLPDSASWLQKALAQQGTPCFEVQKERRALVFRLTYTANLHITSGEGKIVRVRRVNPNAKFNK